MGLREVVKGMDKGMEGMQVSTRVKEHSLYQYRCQEKETGRVKKMEKTSTLVNEDVTIIPVLNNYVEVYLGS
jgi:hypothetical protein